MTPIIYIFESVTLLYMQLCVLVVGEYYRSKIHFGLFPQKIAHTKVQYIVLAEI